MPELASRPDRADRPLRTILAFDFGLQRIGVAVGEAETRSAHPIEGIRAQSLAGRFTAIEQLVKEWKPSHFLVGRPLAENGQPHEMTRRAERFARQLSGRYPVAVILLDERYSSVEVESRMRAAYGSRKAASLSRGKSLDSHAAMILLEQFFHENPAA
jgi:putative holliday junction resolvase